MKPGDFFLGVIDFLAVLVPGSIASFLLAGPARMWLRPYEIPAEGAGAWVAFAVSAYLFGHLLFLLGSTLDDVYDARRNRIHDPKKDAVLRAAEAARAAVAPELHDDQFSTFKWAKAFLQLNAAAARAEVEQLEALSKFFRSLTVLSALCSAWLFLLGARPFHGAVAAVLAYVCFRAFCKHRMKCTQLAYACVVLARKQLFPPGQ
jgi:hypothetical protein